MFRPKCLAALAVCLALPAASGAAVLVVGSPGHAFQSVSPGFVINNNGTPFWDNTSLDGANKNIGHFLTKTGAFSTDARSPAIPASQLEFWATAAGAADPFQTFSSGGASVQTTFVLTVAGNAGQNKLGYRDSSGETILYDPTIHGPVSGQVLTFTPTSTFSLFMWNPTQGYKFYSDTSVAGHTDGAQQHFAVFRQTGSSTLWIGVEDLPGTNHGEGIGDFNDLVFSVQAVPEPGSLTIFGIGAGGMALGWYHRRRRRAG